MRRHKRRGQTVYCKGQQIAQYRSTLLKTCHIHAEGIGELQPAIIICCVFHLVKGWLGSAWEGLARVMGRSIRS